MLRPDFNSHHVRRNRQPQTGITVYVVVSINHQRVFSMSLADNQEDIEVLGVFYTNQDAQQFIDDRSPRINNLYRYIVHETVLHPNNLVRIQRSTFHPEMYN